MAADYNTKINFHYSSKHMIHEKDVYPPLLELIKESNGEMLFVDPDDERFSKKELERMMEEILLIHDSLSFVVDINLDENADYKVCIYEDASKLIYNNDKEQIESITSFSTNSKSSYNVRQLYSPGENMKRIISNMDIKNYLVKNGAETLSDLMLLKAATTVKSKQGKYHHIIDMSLVDSKFIVVHTEYWDVNLTRIYAYDKKQNSLIDVDGEIFDAVADKKNCKKISVKEIDEFCIKNHIAMHYMRDEQEDPELKPVFENKIRFMNTNIVVKCLDANALFVDIREEDKAVITKSFDKLEAYKKKIGKCISKSMLQEFSKFSPKNILGL